MTIYNGPCGLNITKVFVENGEISGIAVDCDGGELLFDRSAKQPAPIDRYIGMHEKLTGGYRHGRTRTQSR